DSATAAAEPLTVVVPAVLPAAPKAESPLVADPATAVVVVPARAASGVRATNVPAAVARACQARRSQSGPWAAAATRSSSVTNTSALGGRGCGRLAIPAATGPRPCSGTRDRSGAAAACSLLGSSFVSAAKGL